MRLPPLGLPSLGLLGRIVLIQGAGLGLAAVLMFLAVHALLGSRVAFFEQKVLSGRASLIADALYTDQQGGLRLQPGRHDREGERQEFGYSVVDAAGTALLRSTDFAAGVLAPAPRGAGAVFSTLDTGGRHYAVASLPLVLEGRGLWVLVGWDLDVDSVIFDDVVRDFLPSLVVVTVPLLALLLLLSVLVVRRFFRPVLDVAHQVRALDPARTDARLPALGLPQEVLPLALAFNGALDRVERGAQAQKEFTADAAHELRTPLAVLGARLQTLPDSPLRAELLQDTRRMARIVGQLLDLARLEQAEAASEVTELVELGRSVVGDLAPEAIARGQELSLAVPEGLAAVWVTAREQDVWHMLRNLIENAIRHTPPGTAIEVSLDGGGGLVVRDDGPGIPAAMQDQVFRRFWRSRRDHGEGAGLGLAIVRRVAEANGGSVTLRSRAGEGTAFVIRLPPAPPAE